MEREWIEQLLARTDVVKIISRYVPLQRKGNTYWGNCPFHHEKDPSFSVTSDKQFYHCFGCKESGNAITFIQKIESLDFIDAVKMLADEVQMTLPEYKGNPNQEEFRLKRDKLYALMKEAALHYHNNLSDRRAVKANEYLTRRQLNTNMVRKFGLGVSLGWQEIIDHLESKGFTKAQMKDAGIAELKGDNYYDVFNERLIFPIINNFNEVVAFGGRALEQDINYAKYRNSSQTIIFDKSKTIYGINLLKKKKQKEHIPYIIMVEGYMDVIALHTAGFDTAVASMGTALTKDQAKMLSNYCPNVYISYDGDTAGQKATMRGLDILAEAGLNIKVVVLPDGLDPDDIIKKYGAERYRQLLNEAMTLTAFKIETIRKENDLSTQDGKSNFAVEATKLLNSLVNPVEKEEYLGLINKYTNYSIETLKKQVALTEDTSTSPQVPQNGTAVMTKLDKAKEFVLASLVHNQKYVDLADDIFSILDDEFSTFIYRYVIESVKSGNYKSPSSLYSLVDEKFLQRLNDIIGYEFVQGDGKEKYKECLLTLKIDKLEKDKQLLAEEYQNVKGMGESRKNESTLKLKQIMALDLKIKQMKSGGGQED